VVVVAQTGLVQVMWKWLELVEAVLVVKENATYQRKIWLRSST
jgi:hypothetical protein